MKKRPKIRMLRMIRTVITMILTRVIVNSSSVKDPETKMKEATEPAFYEPPAPAVNETA
jgi:hypothetical protein